MCHSFKHILGRFDSPLPNQFGLLYPLLLPGLYIANLMVWEDPCFHPLNIVYLSSILPLPFPSSSKVILCDPCSLPLN